MLEQYVSGLLAAYLGKYVRGLSDQQLRVSLWGGRLNLHDLELRPSALEPLSLPIVVHRGYVGSLQITIPWTRLQSEPVSVVMERVFLLVRPKKGAAWDPDAELDQEQARKQHQLALFEAQRREREARTGGGPETPEAGRAKSFIKRVGDLIVNNLQISVRRVHIRYEDADTDPRHPVALGATIGAASCVSTDHDWSRRFVTESTGYAHKLLSLVDWGAYLAPCSAADLLTRQYQPAGAGGAQSVEGLWKAMEALMTAPETRDHTIASPGDAHLRLRLQQGRPRCDDARVAATVLISALRFRCKREQYERMLQVLDYMARFEGIDRFRRFRPLVPVHGNARQWWQFACSCVSLMIREQRERRRLRWDRVVAFREFGREYVPLFKRSQGADWLPALLEPEQRRLAELEANASLDDILWFRRMAHTELRVDELQQATQRRLVEQRTPRRQTWGEWGWSWVGYQSGAADDTALLSAADAGSWTEEQRRQLAVELGFDDAEQPAADAEDVAPPASYVERTVRFHITEGTAELDGGAGSGPIAGMQLQDFAFKADLRGDGMRVVTSLGSLRVTDLLAGSAAGQRIVQRTLESGGGGGGRKDLLRVAYECTTSDEKTSSSLDISMAPLDLVLAPQFADRVATFLRPPPPIAALGASDASAVGATARGRRLAVMAQRLSESCSVTCNMEAPNLIVPFSSVLGCHSLRIHDADYAFPRGGALVVMLGTLSLRTDVGHIRARAARQLKGEPPAEDDAYDRYSCEMRRMRAFVADSGADFARHWQTTGTVAGCPSATHALVEPFDVRTALHRLLPSAAPWSRGAALLVRPTLPACRVVLSRQGVALLLGLSDDLAAVAGRLSPEVPQSLPQGLASLGAAESSTLDSAHSCGIALRFDVVAAQDCLQDVLSPSDRSAAAASASMASGVAALRQGQLLLYVPDGWDAPPASAELEGAEAPQQELHLRHIVDLRSSPVRLSCSDRVLTVTLPQAYGPPKVVQLRFNSVGRLRALYESLHSVVSATRERCSATAGELRFEDADIGTGVRVVPQPAPGAAEDDGGARCAGLVVGRSADSISVRWCTTADGGPPHDGGQETTMSREWWESGGMAIEDADIDRERTQLRLEFDMGTLEVALSDSHDGGGGTFASVVFSGFQAAVDFRPYDQRVRLKLNALQMQEAGGGLVASSASSLPWRQDTAAPPSAADDALIDIRYSSCGEQSPLYRRDSPDTRVMLDAATLNLVVCPALARSLELCWDLVGVRKLSMEGKPRVHAAAPLHLQPARAVPHEEVDPLRVDMSVTAVMKALRLRCLDETAPGVFTDFLMLSVRNARFDIAQSPSSMTANGTLGDAVAEECADGGLLREVIGVADPGRGSVVSFRFESPVLRVTPTEAFVAGTATASMKQIRSAFHLPTLLRFIHWATSGAVVARMQRISARRPVRVDPADPAQPQEERAPPPRAPGVIVLDLAIENPLVSLAPEPGDPRKLVAALGSVRVRQKLVRNDEAGTAEQVNTIQFRQMSVTSESGGHRHSIASDLDVTLVNTSAVVNPDNALPAQTVDVETGDITLSVDEADWGLLLQVAARNLLASYTPPVRGAPQPPPRPGPSTAIKQTMAVHTNRFCIRMLSAAASPPARPADAEGPVASVFGVFVAEGFEMRRAERCDGKGDLSVSLEALSVSDVRHDPPRSLVSCGGEQPAPDERLIELTMSTNPAHGVQHIRFCVGRPGFRADPTAIFHVQDFLASPESVDAVQHLLSSGGKADKPPGEPMMVVANIALREMSLLGLEHDGETPLFSVSASDVKVDMELSGGEQRRMQVRLGDLQLNAFQDGRQVEAMGLAEDDALRSLVEVTFERGCDTAPGFKQYARVRLHSVRATMLPGFWQRLGNWSSEGPLRQLAMIGTAKAERLARELASSADLTQIDVEWNGPHVVIPMHCDAAERLTLTLGGLTVRNELLPVSEPVEGAEIEVEEVLQLELLQVRLHHKPDALGRDPRQDDYDVVRDIDVSAEFRRRLLQGAPDPAAEPSVRCSVGMVGVSLADEQMQLLMAIARAHAEAAPPRVVAAAVGGDAPPPPPRTGAGSGVNLDAVFAGLRLELSASADGHDDPLARLDMREVSLTAAGGSLLATLDSITVTDLAPRTPEKMRDVLSTVALARPETADERQPPCLRVSFDPGTGHRQEAEVHVFNLHLLLAPDFLTALHRFAVKAGSTGVAAPAVPRGAAVIPTGATEVRAMLDAFSVSIIDGVAPLLTLAVDATEVEAELLHGGGYVVSGRLGAVTLQDCCTAGTNYCNIVAPSPDQPSGDGIVEFRAATQEAHEGYDVRLDLTMRSLTVVYLPVFIARVQRFFTDGGVEWITRLAAEGADHAARAAAETAAEAATQRRPLPMRVSGAVHNPIIIFPVEASGDAAVEADLGEIRLHNSTGAGAEQVHVTVSDMALTTRRKGGGARRVLRGAGVEVAVTRVLAQSADEGEEKPDIAVALDITGGEATLDAADWTTLLATAMAQTRAVDPVAAVGRATEVRAPAELTPTPSALRAAGQTSASIRVHVAAPLVGLTLCNEAGMHFAVLRLRDIRVEHSTNGSGSRSGFLLRDVELRQLWTSQGRTYCRELCFAAEAVRGSAAPPSAGRPCIQAELEELRDGTRTQSNAVVDLNLPYLLFAAPLLTKLHAFFYLPYKEALFGDTSLKPADAVIVEHDLVLDDDLFLTPHRVLRVRSTHRNCIHVRAGAGKTPCVHLVRDATDRRPLIVIDAGVALRFVDVSVRVYSDGGLSEYIDAGEGSYACHVGESTFESFAGGPPPGTWQTGSAVVPVALRCSSTVRLSCSFGVGIAGETKGGDIDQRCIMLSGQIGAKYTAESVLGDPPARDASVELTNLSAAHLPVAAPRVHVAGADMLSAAPVVAPEGSSANLLDPTGVEMQLRTHKDAAGVPQLRVQIAVCRPTRLRVCLGDVEAIMHLLNTLPASASPDPSHAPVQRQGSDERWQMRFNCSSVTGVLVDDSMGTPVQLFDLTMKEVGVTAAGAGQLNQSAEGTVLVFARHYNPDVCEWEPLLEAVRLEARSATTQAGLRHRAHDSRAPRAAVKDVQLTVDDVVNINVTPVLLRSVSRTVELYRHFATGVPKAALRARRLYTLLNESGREVKFSPGDGTVTAVADKCELPFDATSHQTQQPVAYVAVVYSSADAGRIGPPPSAEEPCAGMRSGAWMAVPIGKVGKHRSGGGFIVEVTNDQGRKLVRFRTAVVIENHLTEMVFVEGVGPVKGKQLSESDAPGRASVPHDRIGKPDGVSIRPLVGSFQEARLGYLYTNLLHVPEKWSRYVVHCKPAAAQPGLRPERRDGVSFTCTLERDKAIEEVSVVLHPLLVLENRLPVRVAFTIVADGEDGSSREAVDCGEAEPFGGCRRVITGPARWPHCRLRLTLACAFGRQRLESDDAGAVVWSGPPPGVIGSMEPGSRPADMRARSIPLRATHGGGVDLQVHVAYGPRGSVIFYAPLWVVNLTEYPLEVHRTGADGVMIPACKSGRPADPCPVSPPDSDPVLCFRCGDGEHSSERMDPYQTSPQTITVPCPTLRGMYRHLGVGTETLTWPKVQGGSAQTHVLRVAPRWVFANATGLDITVRIVSDYRPALTLPPGESKECCTSGHHDDSIIEVKFSDDAYVHNRFSKAFSVGDVGDHHLRLNYDLKHAGATHRPGIGCFAGPTAPDGSTEYFRVLRATVQEAGPSLTVTFRACEKPTYVIENRSAFMVAFQQDGLQPVVTRHLPPRTTVPFAFDDPFQERLLEVKLFLPTGRAPLVGKRVVGLDKLTEEGDKIAIRVPYGASVPAPWVWLRVRHAPSALVTVLSLTEEHYINQRPRHSPGITNALVSLRRIGLSLSIPRKEWEVAYVSLSDVSVDVVSQELDVECNVSVGNFQIDDASEEAPLYPVVLQRDPEHIGKPFLKLEVLRSLQTPDVLVIRRMWVAMVPLSLLVSDTFVLSTLSFFDETVRVLDQERSGQWDPGVQQHRPALAEDESAWSKKVYLGSFVVSRQDLTVTVSRQDIPGDPLNSFGADRWWLKYLLRSMDRGMLSWDRYEAHDDADRLWMLARSLQLFYWNSTRKQLPALIFSLNALGNPASIAKGIAEGVCDLVSMPATGVVEADNIGGAVTGAVTGVASGFKSLVQKSASGAAGSVSSLARAVAKTTSQFSFDPEWMRDRMARTRGERPPAWRVGVDGVKDAVVGLRGPAAGYQESGWSGAAAGVMVAGCGLVAKPVTGALEAVSDGLDTIAGRQGAFGVRVRRPRSFRPGGVLADYAAREMDPADAQLPGLDGEWRPERVMAQYRQGRLDRAAVRSHLTIGELSEVADWDEFRLMLPPEEFAQHAHLARDRYLSSIPPSRFKRGSVLPPEQQGRVEHLYRTLGAAELVSNASLQVTPAEVAHVTTWDEFRALMGPEMFHRYAHLARDRCVLPTSGFTLLNNTGSS
eukprot:TRINITY_DN942_c0_g1_i1.p1 TRINITY_DN942_c0_g1~~TRINITY_DN942_c0_g1_i1.p1  ORF type:complete len:4440 (+),score=1706.16 TRINITY_DN942_c0_g1_i1:65-13384(+)